jgi:predicted transcriptional regulator of viral defense system
MSKKQPPSQSQAFHRAEELFRQHDGMMRTQEALHAGIHPRTLYALRDAGVLEPLSRGIYRLREAGPLGNPDLVMVAMRAPGGVICLISALAFHELTTQIPHEVYVAVPRGAEPPHLDYPPVRTFWFTGKAFTEGIERKRVDDIDVRIYSREKTLADCFKYRHKIGMDTVLEAIRLYKQSGHTKIDALMRYAEICRVANRIRPYSEAML